MNALIHLQEFLSPKCTLAGKDLPDFEHLVNFVIDSSSKEIHTLQVSFTYIVYVCILCKVEFIHLYVSVCILM